MKRIALALIAVLCIAAAPAPTKPTAAYGVWQIHMTNYTMNLKSGEYKINSPLRIVRPGGDATADRGYGNQKKGTLVLVGNVVVHDQSGAFDSAHGSKNKAPSTLTCDKLSVDDKAKLYTATGHVHYVQADTTSDSDNGVLNDATHVLTLDGNVHVTQAQRTLTADHMVYNTATGDVTLTGKDVILTMPGGPGRALATPRPIHIPFGKKPTPRP